MNQHHIGRLQLFLAASFFAFLGAASTAHAASLTWTGATGNWNNAGNWTPAAVPANGDSVVFDGTTPNNSNSNDLVGRRFNGITFNAGAAGYALGGNAINLGVQTTGTGITHAGDIVNNSSNAQTIAFPITLDPGKHLITTGAAALNLNGAVTQSKGSTAVFTNGGGGINLTGTGLNNVNGILGGWASLGADWAALDGSNIVVAYSGYTDVAGGGTIADAPASNVRINAGTTTAITMAAAGSTRINSLLYSLGTGNQTVTVGAGNTLVLGQNGGIYNATNFGAGTLRTLTIGAAGVGSLTAGDGVNPANITLSSAPIGSTSTVMTVASNITNNANAPVSVTLQGGYFGLTGTANTFTGGLYILSGRLSQPRRRPSATTTSLFSPAGRLTITPRSPTMFPSPATAPPKRVASAPCACLAAPNSPARSRSWRMPPSAPMATSRELLGSLARSPVLAACPLAPPPPPATTARAASSSSGPQPALLQSTTTPATRQSPAPPAGPGRPPYRHCASAPPPTRTSCPTASPAVSPADRRAISSLTPPRQGPIAAPRSTSTGPPKRLTASSSTGANGANTFVESLVAGANLVLGDSNATAIFDGLIRNGGTGGVGTLSVRKIGSGTQTFTGNNTYTGTTDVLGGTLLVNGKHTGAGNYITANTATLGGTGSITFGSGSSLTINSGATLAPGASIGTFTVDGSATAGGVLSFLSGSLLKMELDAGLAADKVALINGAASDISFAGATINFTDLTGGSLATGAYTLFSSDVPNAYSGLVLSGSTITGGLTIGSGLGAYSTSLELVGNNIVLNLKPVPEPATCVLASVTIAALATSRRRPAHLASRV